MPLALAYSTIWLVVLWAAEYPMDERVSVAITAYIALFVARAVIGNLTIVLLRALRNYGLLVAERAGFEVSDASQTRNAPGVNAVAVLFILALISTILGCSLVPTTYIADAYGLPPLNPYFSVVGWVMLAAGMIVLMAFFALSVALFKTTDSLSNKTLSTRVISIRQSETLVRRFGTQPSLVA